MTPVSSGAALGIQIGNPPADLNPVQGPGTASITTSNLSAGTHSVTGVWPGDANVAAGTSAVLVQTVQPATVPTSTALTVSPNPSVYGGSVTLTATVSPATATGTVTFSANGAPVGSAILANGQAQVQVTTLQVGTNSLTAAYSGDANDIGSVSPLVTQTVTPAMAPSSITLASSANPSSYGQSVTFSVTVTPSTATGTVQFLDGATELGTATIAGGGASLSISSLPVGAHSITAVYSGDANDLASTSAAVVQTVN
jgi:hypothetical protein